MKEQKFFKTVFNDLKQFFVELFNGQFFSQWRDDLNDLQEYFLDRDHQNRIKKLNKQISKLMELFSMEKIKAEHIENEITSLQQEKEELETKIIDITKINEILDIKVDEFSNASIKYQLERFEEMLSDDNLIEMRSLVRDFFKKITLDPKEEPRAKKWKRHIHIDSYVRALTMIKLASPRGFEPLLPA